MSQRRNTSTAEDVFDLFHEIFMHTPTWVCLPVAGIAFVALQLLIAKVATGQPFLEMAAAQYGKWIAGIFAATILLAGAKAEINKRTRRKLLDKQEGIETIRELNWAEFELLVGEAYRRLGYDVTETGGGGADGGIDLKLRGTSGQTVLVQCKQWRDRKVGVRPVRELYGVLMGQDAASAIFVTTGVYTKEATVFARGKAIELVDGEMLERLIAPVRKTMQSPATAQQVLRVSADDQNVEEIPKCPRCGGEMVRRTARRGANVGSEFWGCSKFPECNGTRTL